MKLNVTIECPVCHDELKCVVTLVIDSEGASPPYGPPGGSRTFYSLEDFSINWSGHFTCDRTMTEEVNNKLIETITEAAIEEQKLLDSEKGCTI